MRNDATTAVILAGGMGTRLRSSVPNLPKPMAPINGRPFLEYQMDYWINQGIRKFILSVGYRREAIIEHFKSRYRDANIQYAVEESPLGTGGGLLVAMEYITDDMPVLVLNGDTFFEVNFAKLCTFHRLKQSDWTFSLFKSREVGRYLGMSVQDDGRVVSLTSDNKAKAEMMCNGGVYLVEPNVIKTNRYKTGEKISLENDILSRLMCNGTNMYACLFEGRFIDIGIPSDYLRATEILVQ